MLPYGRVLDRLDDDSWDEVLSFIKVRRVILVLGPIVRSVQTPTAHGMAN